MDKEYVNQIMDEVVSALREAGYDPYNQLTGYLQTGDLAYITRKNDARDKIRVLDQDMVRSYISFDHGNKC